MDESEYIQLQESGLKMWDKYPKQFIQAWQDMTARTGFPNAPFASLPAMPDRARRARRETEPADGGFVGSKGPPSGRGRRYADALPRPSDDAADAEQSDDLLGLVRQPRRLRWPDGAQR